MSFTVPTPPPAYWEHVPWWGFIILVLVIAFLVSPFALQVLRGRAGAYVTREQAFATQQARLDQQRETHLATVVAAEASARAALASERAAWERDRDGLESDRDNGWDRLRGMEEQAHDYRHGWRNLVMRFNALRDLFGQLARGEMATERAQALLAQIPPAEEPDPVPSIQEISRRPPPAE